MDAGDQALWTVGLLVASWILGAFALPIVCGLFEAWMWLYTLGLPRRLRESHREELRGHLLEHRRQLRERGYAPPLAAMWIARDVLFGAIDNLRWRLENDPVFIPLLVLYQTESRWLHASEAYEITPTGVEIRGYICDACRGHQDRAIQDVLELHHAVVETRKTAARLIALNLVPYPRRRRVRRLVSLAVGAGVLMAAYAGHPKAGAKVLYRRSRRLRRATS
jgi:hypothetical protein